MLCQGTGARSVHPCPAWVPHPIGVSLGISLVYLRCQDFKRASCAIELSEQSWRSIEFATLD